MCHNIDALCMSAIPVIYLTTSPQFIQELVRKTAIGPSGEIFLKQTKIISVLDISSPNIYWDSNEYAEFLGGCALNENKSLVIYNSNNASMQKMHIYQNGLNGVLIIDCKINM